MALPAPLIGLVSLVLALWPLLIARLSTGAGGCAVYPVMTVPVWLTFLMFANMVLSDPMGEREERQFLEAQVALFSYFFFVHAAMILALRYRFEKADSRDFVSLGEKVTVSLYALAPLGLIAAVFLFQGAEWLVEMIKSGK